MVTKPMLRNPYPRDDPTHREPRELHWDDPPSGPLPPPPVKVVIPNEPPDPGPWKPDPLVVILPPVPGGTGGPNDAPIKVNTEAVTYFATALKTLEEPIRKAMAGVETVDVRPGAFYNAFELNESIDGDAKLRVSTKMVLTKILDALVLIQEACHKIVREYDTREELNNADAAKFQQLVNGAFAAVDELAKQR